MKGKLEEGQRGSGDAASAGRRAAKPSPSALACGVTLVWSLSDLRSQQECWISRDFCIRIEPINRSLEQYQVAVIRHDCYMALYRSSRSFQEKEAKAEAIRQGIRVARQQARQYARIADLLGAAVQHRIGDGLDKASATGEQARDPNAPSPFSGGS